MRKYVGFRLPFIHWSTSLMSALVLFKSFSSSVTQQPNFGLSRLFLRFLDHTQLYTHTHMVTLLWTSDQPVADATTYTTYNKHKRRTSMFSAGFRPEMPAIDRRQTYDLDSTGMGLIIIIPVEVSRISLLQSIFFLMGHSKPPKSKIYLNQEYLVGRATEYRMMAPIICSTITAFLFYIKNVYQFTCTQQKAPENSEVHRSLQNCGLSVRNLLHVTTLGPINSRRFLNFWKICGPWYKWYLKIHSLPHKECAPPPIWRPNANVAEGNNRGLFGKSHDI